jgi:xylan 1,4-beta-xylosidase
MYSSYTAAVFARKYELADRHGVDLDGALTWAFEFEGQPWFAGFRVLASNGITLPVFNVFRMFREMGGQRVAVESTADVPLDTMMKDGVRKAPDVTALASLEDHKLALLVWHYHDDDIAGPAADVTLDLTGLPAGAKKAKIRQFLIDETHSNAFTAWKKQGSPAAPSPAQYAELEAASQLASVPPSALAVGEKNQLSLKFPLPRQAVSLLVLEW